MHFFVILKNNGFLIDRDLCPNILRRYVDDIFVTFNSHNQLKKFVQVQKAGSPTLIYVR